MKRAQSTTGGMLVSDLWRLLRPTQWSKNAVLFAAPSGESWLIDTGNTNTTRDVDRIMAAARDAGVDRDFHLIIQ